jgi:hypothetical protein
VTFIVESSVFESMTHVDDRSSFVLILHNLTLPSISVDIRRVFNESNVRPQRADECAVAYGDDFKRLRAFFDEYRMGPSSIERNNKKKFNDSMFCQ